MNVQLLVKPTTRDQPTIYQIDKELFMKLWPKDNHLNNMHISSSKDRIPHCAYFGGLEQNLKHFYPSRVSFREENGEIKMSFSDGRHRALWLIEQGFDLIPLDIMSGEAHALSAGIITVAKDIWIAPNIKTLTDYNETWKLTQTYFPLP